MDAGVAAGERVIGRQDRQAIATRERHGAAISAGRVAEGVLSGDGEVMGSSSRAGSGIAADHEALGDSRVDGDGRIPGDGSGDRIGGGDRLAAGSLENDPGEGVHAGVGGREGIVTGQDGRRIGTREVHRTQVTRQRVVIGVLGGDRDAERRAGGCRGRRRDLQVRRHRTHVKLVGADVVGRSLRSGYAVEIHRHLGQRHTRVYSR